MRSLLSSMETWLTSSLQQIFDIYSGKINNWLEVGAGPPDRAPVARPIPGRMFTFSNRYCAWVRRITRPCFRRIHCCCHHRRASAQKSAKISMPLGMMDWVMSRRILKWWRSPGSPRDLTCCPPPRRSTTSRTQSPGIYTCTQARYPRERSKTTWIGSCHRRPGDRHRSGFRTHSVADHDQGPETKQTHRVGEAHHEHHFILARVRHYSPGQNLGIPLSCSW
jgi:hypothetical protein